MDNPSSWLNKHSFEIFQLVSSMCVNFYQQSIEQKLTRVARRSDSRCSVLGSSSTSSRSFHRATRRDSPTSWTSWSFPGTLASPSAGPRCPFAVSGFERAAREKKRIIYLKGELFYDIHYSSSNSFSANNFSHCTTWFNWKIIDKNNLKQLFLKSKIRGLRGIQKLPI